MNMYSHRCVSPHCRAPWLDSRPHPASCPFCGARTESQWELEDLVAAQARDQRYGHRVSWGPTSLDAPITDDGRRSLHDVVAADA